MYLALSMVLTITPASKFMMSNHYAILEIEMICVVKHEPCVMHVQRAVQVAQQSSTRCVFTAVVLPYLMDKCGCCVEAYLVAMHSDASTQ